MADDNRISAEITAAVKAQVLQKITEIFNLLTMLINLTADQRRSIPNIRTQRAGMVPTFLQEMNAHHDLVPSYVSMTELAKDKQLFSDLEEIAARVFELFEALTDTSQAAASDMYLAFLAFYNNVKEAARRGVVGADAILAALRVFFARGPQTTTPTTPPTT